MAKKLIHSLAAKKIVKSFGDTIALNDVSIELISGEIHGLVGHNGAGKSTLLRIFSGSITPDSGHIEKDNYVVYFNNPADAIKQGVATVYQELSLLPNLTIAENTFLGTELSNFGLLNHSKMEKQTKILLDRFNLNISPKMKVGDLSIAQRQLVEIVIAVHRNADFLLLDEPTSSLEAGQIERMLTWLNNLAKKEKIGILFITHKIDELLTISDRITILADGVVRLQKSKDEVDRTEIVSAIMGSQNKTENPNIILSLQSFKPTKAIDGNTVISVKDLKTARLSHVSLHVREKKVTGLYGLVGSGRSRFLRSLIGLEPVVGGEILLFGEKYIPKNPGYAANFGIVFLTEDRKYDGFIPQMTAKQNCLLPVLHEFTNIGILQLKEIDKEATSHLKNLFVHGDIDGPIIRLSGGNQQKVLFARAIRQRPRLLLLDEPTKGVDIGAKKEIHRLIRYLVEQQNITIIMVSSEEQEILSVSDDIAIFLSGTCDGTIYSPKQLNENKLRSLAWKIENQEIY